MKAVFALALLAVSVAAMSQQMAAVERVRGADADWPGFVGFVAKYGRSYATVREVNAKFDIFKANMIHAAQVQARNPKARFGVTKFSDMSQEEFRSTMLMTPEMSKAFTLDGQRRRALAKPVHHHHKKNTTGQDIDWCAKGICTPIKDQGQCGSCWAFSATETLESCYMQAGNPQQILGPQQIVDCDKGGNDQGCNGGMPSGAIDYLQQAGGQETEDNYPYTGQDGQCNFDSSKCAVDPKGNQPLPDPSDDGLQRSLQNSVVSVGVDASQWSSYQGGILTDCGTQLDHAVVATGFMSDQGGYYIVRNSWNSNWGENGFIFIAATGDVCGIADNAITVQC